MYICSRETFVSSVEEAGIAQHSDVNNTSFQEDFNRDFFYSFAFPEF
jgi:hypothetical protein